MTKFWRKVTTTMAGLVGVLIALQAYAGVVVIGNPNLSFSHLSQEEIRQLFLEQPVSLNSDTSIQVYDQPSDSYIYAEFYRELFNWSTVRISNYWDSNVFNGQGNPPPKLDGDREVIAAVEGTPGAISYIDSSSLPLAQGNVKVLYQSDLAPVQYIQSKPVPVKPRVKSKVKVKKVKVKPQPVKKKPSAPKISGKVLVKQINSSLYKQTVNHPVKLVAKVTPKAKPISDLWGAISNHFTLQVDANKPQVRVQIEAYLKNKSQLTQVLANAKPYLSAIVSIAKQKKVPMEVALIPAVVSGYNPTVNSAGLWQIKIHGGKRLNTIAATKVAINQLALLHKRYSNWELTLAAYYAGNAGVQSAINANKNHNKPLEIWNLSLPNQSQQFVAKIVALAQLIKYSSYYGLQLPLFIGSPKAVGL